MALKTPARFRGRAFVVPATGGSAVQALQPNAARVRFIMRVPLGGGDVLARGEGNSLSPITTEAATFFAGDVLDEDGPSASAGLEVLSTGAAVTVQLSEWFE